ncbi:sulfur carrier protein ThiS [Synechococcus sp. RedBA-s]|uniref:sulfur carrier protein ThiS n=1 Tax=Synechococcus sp. RedBA-s TaxID=2823741 RepID=UPI0020CBB37F|nr:sulfur carrier protein ThiS [Synechococcus sp. RedBA-s]MCP9801062.1 sulfur carrier protein ThiS [Synechococcus sp. RedBA-s]
MSDQQGPGANLTIQLNGDARSCPAGLPLLEVLRHFGYEPRLVVVEFNGDILPRTAWADQAVGGDAVLEVVTIVGGGS